MTSEKRLLIDLALLREAYKGREISEIVWIPGAENGADALTNLKPCPALAVLMHQNTINLDPNAWVDRPPPAWDVANAAQSNLGFRPPFACFTEKSRLTNFARFVLTSRFPVCIRLFYSKSCFSIMLRVNAIDMEGFPGFNKFHSPETPVYGSAMLRVIRILS